MYHLVHQKDKIECTKMEYLNNIQKIRICKVKNIVLELAINLKEIEDIFNKSIIIATAYMDKSTKGEMKKKRRRAKNNWYD